MVTSLPCSPATYIIQATKVWWLVLVYIPVLLCDYRWGTKATKVSHLILTITLIRSKYIYSCARITQHTLGLIAEPIFSHTTNMVAFEVFHTLGGVARHLPPPRGGDKNGFEIRARVCGVVWLYVRTTYGILLLIQLVLIVGCLGRICFGLGFLYIKYLLRFLKWNQSQPTKNYLLWGEKWPECHFLAYNFPLGFRLGHWVGLGSSSVSW